MSIKMSPGGPSKFMCTEASNKTWTGFATAIHLEENGIWVRQQATVPGFKREGKAYLQQDGIPA